MLCCSPIFLAQGQLESTDIFDQPASLFLSTDIRLLLARAEHAINVRRYADAAEYYRLALRLTTTLPEAEYGLGLVSHADGLRDRAEQKYLLALSQQRYLRVPQMAYEIRYQLAELYQEQGELFNYEQQLNVIVADDPEYSRSSLRDNMRRVFYESGLDRIAELYRFDSQFAFIAHAELGEHYVRSGNYSQAVDHFLFAFVLYYQRLAALNEQHILNPTESDFSELLVAAHRVTPIRNQLQEGYNIYRLLFYFGAAVYGDRPHSMRWGEIFSLLDEFDGDSSQWINLARQRLLSPQLEPLYE